VLTVTMYLSLAIGMLVSAASREGRQAIPRTFGAITLLAGVLPLLWELQSLGGGHLDFLLWPSPVYAYIKGFDDSYLTRYGAQEFWTALATLFSLASGCIITASIHLPRSWQKDSAADPNMERPHFHFFSETPRRRRPPLADKNPFFWLALGDRFGTWILALLGLLWAVMMALSAVLPQDMGVQLGMMVAFGLHLAAKVLIASESGRRFHQDRQSGALEVLLATPLPARDIVAGQREALWKQIQPALWLIPMVNVLTLWVFLFMSTSDSGGFGLEEFISVLEVFLGGVVMLWLDASALIWLGMWRGLKAKKYPRSVLANLAQVLLPPWLAIFFLAFVLVGSASEVDVIILLAFWFGLGAVIDISAIEFAQNNLVKSLRSIVSEGPAGHSF